MATVSGFLRWLKSLRTLNAQRHAIERHDGELRDLRQQAATQNAAVDLQQRALEDQQRAMHETAAGLQALEDRVLQRRFEELQVRDGVRLEITGLTSRLDSLAAATATVEAAARSLEERVLQGRFEELQVRDGVRLEITGLTSRLDTLANATAAVETAARSLEGQAQALRARLAGIAPPFPPLGALDSDATAAWFHSTIEGMFRGPREEIRKRLGAYVPHLASIPVTGRNHTALDIGCGRGEWLEVLRDERLQGIGVDDNPVSIERCRAAGLEAIRGDALAYLRTQADDSIALVTAFHVIEHLAIETVVEMLFEIRRVLIPGGLLMLETPNPDNVLVASSSFYLDPTHRHPIPAPLLRVIVEFARFDVVTAIALQPDEAILDVASSERWPTTLTRLLAGPRDTGIVARKPGESAPGP